MLLSRTRWWWLLFSACKPPLLICLLSAMCAWTQRLTQRCFYSLRKTHQVPVNVAFLSPVCMRPYIWSFSYYKAWRWISKPCAESGWVTRIKSHHKTESSLVCFKISIVHAYPFCKEEFQVAIFSRELHWSNLEQCNYAWSKHCYACDQHLPPGPMPSGCAATFWTHHVSHPALASFREYFAFSELI